MFLISQKILHNPKTIEELGKLEKIAHDEVRRKIGQHKNVRETHYKNLEEDYPPIFTESKLE